MKNGMWVLLQVREKEDRHQQQKIRGFLQPVEDIQAARAAAAGADMEVRDFTVLPLLFWHPTGRDRNADPLAKFGRVPSLSCTYVCHIRCFQDIRLLSALDDRSAGCMAAAATQCSLQLEDICPCRTWGSPRQAHLGGPLGRPQWSGRARRMKGT